MYLINLADALWRKILAKKDDGFSQVFGWAIPELTTRQKIHLWIIGRLNRISVRLSKEVGRLIEANIISVPNILSFFRAVAGPIFLIFFRYEVAPIFNLINIAYAFLSDYADGWWARRTDQETVFGKKFDALCDKVYVVFLVIAFWPLLWSAIIYPLIFLESLLLLGATFSKKLVQMGIKIEIGSNWYGRLKYNFQGIAAILLTLMYPDAANYVLILANFLAIGSLYRHLHPAR